jgi:hypothetical protein
VTEAFGPNSEQAIEADRKTFSRRNDLERRLADWYRDLPEELRWGEEKISRKPLVFLALHLQYHYTLILLYCPMLGNHACFTSNAECVGTPLSSFSSYAWSVCTHHAICIAEIFATQCHLLKSMHPFVLGLHHIVRALLNGRNLC